MVRLLAVLFAAPALALAQAYPAKPIRMVIPFAPGGIDVTARMVIPRMTEDLGQSIVIENRPGAGGLTGSAFVAKSEPDGYTVLMNASGPLLVAPLLLKKVPFDTLRDFTPITVLVRNLNVVAVTGELPVNNVKELLEYAKRNPGKLSYGTAGVGTNQHLEGEMFNRAGGTDLVHIPYKGFGQVMQDLAGGRIQLAFNVYEAMRPMLASGKIRLIAVTDVRRSPLLPDLATVAETLPAFRKPPTWTGGLFGPAGLPAPILRRFYAATAKAIATPDVRSRFEASGYQVVGNTPEEFAAMLKSDLEETARALKPLNIQLEE
jgi:tripartite-type tricarboxylate transporter receptor subunit TctC